MPTIRRVNAPYFGSGVIRYPETAILWFGQVAQTSNYADVRVGYNNSELFVNVAVFDRRLWYDPTHSGDLTKWDAITLLLDTNGNSGHQPRLTSYRFIAQLTWGENPPSQWQSASRGDGAQWIVTPVTFTSLTSWRGDAPNNNNDDRGWFAEFHIPFSSLGLSARPDPGTLWGLSVLLHDRDDAAGTPIPDQKWPEDLSRDQPTTWGQLHFGLATYAVPAVSSRQEITIRQGLNGAIVPNAAVGGTTGNLCPGDSNYIWNQWGNANFGGALDFNLQNQGDVADWPCFAKYYITFPLSSVPLDKVIVSATLTLHEWGGSDPNVAQPSLIQVLTVADDWIIGTLTWNNAPLALENVSQTWVNPIPPPGFAAWPGVPYMWDVSRAVAQAYAAQQPLRLALYEADSAQHSGKYFTTSEAEDWDAAGRPTINITFGNP
jgi:hypothetical protein